MTDGVSQAKRALRRALRAHRRGLAPSERAAWDDAAQRALMTHPAFHSAHRVLLYRAFDGEVSTDAVAAAALDARRQVLYARVGEDRILEWVQPTGWAAGALGLPVPQGPAAPAQPDDFVVVPGVAFDPFGFRVGLGGGIYDRTLASQQACTAVGLAYAFQRVAHVPRAPWDVRLDAVATDRGLVLTRPEESNH